MSKRPLFKGRWKALRGECLKRLRNLPDNSIDWIVTDPPYGLSFMGKNWDHGVPGKAYWEEMLRVVKPGGSVFAFGGTRTYHRLVCAIEDAGWEIRDGILAWCYGQGFPKSHNIAKTTTLSEWEGYGTALKPSYEPIVWAMKPLDGTYAKNARKHGVAGINIDRGRIGTNKDVPASARRAAQGSAYGDLSKAKGNTSGFDPHTGRWPSNIILQHAPKCVCVGDMRVKSGVAVQRHGGGQKIGTGRAYRGSKGLTRADMSYAGKDGKESVPKWACVPECPVRMLDDSQGFRSSGKPGIRRKAHETTSMSGRLNLTGKQETGYGDTGYVSRFFYCTKSSKKDRNFGLPKGEVNTHPTVKPLDLMRYLVRLAAPPGGGVILDPFMGSGSTGVACLLEGSRFLGIELEQESFETAVKRLRGV